MRFLKGLVAPSPDFRPLSQVSFQNNVKEIRAQENAALSEAPPTPESSAGRRRTPFGTLQTSFASSQLFCYKCNHRYAYAFAVH